MSINFLNSSIENSFSVPKIYLKLLLLYWNLLYICSIPASNQNSQSLYFEVSLFISFDWFFLPSIASRSAIIGPFLSSHWPFRPVWAGCVPRLDGVWRAWSGCGKGVPHYVRNGRGLEALRTSVGRFWEFCVPYPGGPLFSSSPGGDDHHRARSGANGDDRATRIYRVARSEPIETSGPPGRPGKREPLLTGEMPPWPNLHH